VPFSVHPIHPVAGSVLASDGLAERLGSPCDRVLVDVVGDGLPGRVLSSCGAAKSGKPWDRLIAPCFTDRRVISRMTDSVKDDARREGLILGIRGRVS
jgi:hypothetical protein